MCWVRPVEGGDEFVQAKETAIMTNVIPQLERERRGGLRAR